MCVPHNIVMGINNGVLIYFKIIKILNIYPSYLDEFFYIVKSMRSHPSLLLKMNG